MNLRARTQGSVAWVLGVIVALGIQAVAAESIEFGSGLPLTSGLAPTGKAIVLTEQIPPKFRSRDLVYPFQPNGH